MRKEIFLPVQSGKELIGNALASRKDVLDTAKHHTVVVIKGTTNAYLAEALCHNLGIRGFRKEGFVRGVIRPADQKASAKPQKNDLVIQKGKVLDTDIYGIVEQLGQEDMIFKGANAVNPEEHACAVLIGNPKFGTMAPITEACIGRRVKLIHPVGLEKRVSGSLHQISALVNDADTTGLRLALSPGVPYTETDAFRDLFHLDAHLIAAGGVDGYEGGCLFLIEGMKDDLEKAEAFAGEHGGMQF